MKFYILCPANIVSGGPELAHQLCAEINKNEFEAYMYYTLVEKKEPASDPVPEKFKKYNTESVNTFEDVDKEDNIVVIPEALTDWFLYFEHAKIVIWWMSVDNFLARNDKVYLNNLDSRTTVHLVQSEYARDYLKKNNINNNKIMWLSDYIGDIYLKFIFPAQYRKNIILFNPKKGAQNIVPIMRKCNFIEWRALADLTEEEMVLNMQMSKIYIDFGHHPGKDRIPREAASCGCCVITNREGSAAFFDDVPIDDEYKFDMVTDEDAIVDKIRDITENYESHFRNFERYRESIKKEKAKFSEDTKKFIEFILNK